MHRIAGAFLSGAGLLIILPLLLKDTISGLINVIFGLSWQYIIFCAVPFAISILIPLIALYLLVKDLCLFYFTANIPMDLSESSTTEPFHPRFSLTAIPFAEATYPSLKKEIRRIQFRTKLRFFLIPYASTARKWLTLISKIPAAKKIQLPATDEWLPVQRDEDDDALRMAFGIAGAYDRDLLQECAKSELSLIRHNLHLRRLVMRYMKALLILVWTALVAIVVNALSDAVLKQSLPPFSSQNAILIGNLVWATGAPFIVRAPVRWIYYEFDRNVDDDVTRDRQIVHFEQWVLLACVVTSLLAATGCFFIIGKWWGLAGLACLVPVGFWISSWKWFHHPR